MNTKEKYEKYVILSFLKKLQPVVVDEARGFTYRDENGREYIDCFAGISVANAGHGNDEVRAAAKAQIDKLVHCCSYVYYNRPVADLAEAMAKIVPGLRMQKTFFGNSGAEAIEGAMRLAKHFTKKNEFIALQSSFHGRTYATLSITGNQSRKQHGGPYMPGVTFAPTPYCYRCPLKLKYPSCGVACAHAVEDIIRYNTSGNVAAFIAEPILGEGGIITPPDEYFRIVKSILEKHGILFICDEVQTGFARTGKMFAIEHYGVQPDIVTTAKGIADGFPISGFTARAEVADSFSLGSHLSTFGGNPVSAAAALANIRYMSRVKLAEQSRKKGARLRKKLEALARKLPAIGDIRGKGLMVGIELVSDRKSKAPAADLAGAVQARALDAGVLIGTGGVFGNVLRIQPPLVIDEKTLDHVVETIGAAIRAGTPKLTKPARRKK
jgi:4-aminobutyrate aminotransferase